MFILYIFVFIIGAIIGSFLNVVIYRVPREESITYPPSHCTRCGERLKAHELIPIISYILLKGRCSHCGERISPRYIAVEAITGLSFVLLFWKFGVSADAFFYALLVSMLISLSFIDLEHMIIPDKILAVGFIGGIVCRLIDLTGLHDYLIGVLLGFGLLFLIALISGGMGMGDAKLMGVIALYVDWKLVLSTLFLSFVIGAVISLILIASKVKGRKDYIPFGPFISVGAFISILFGYQLLNWYMTLIRG
ncbi:leader peptidase (prepilin peptidase) / N-methyltransferase [Caldanaerobius fijiensis DSM 17918]|uniref:Leader peptidase (Prepilin peptidase) / N-methyltransferase n=2 Tax=Caldanaerobius TaxID=862261 RepID=A0A1M4U3M1_9THEO|nr:leader peptidase (prepilin peptidase) / N-methyltransferase [Caldanaerobius fijiensis DSM 17918]